MSDIRTRPATKEYRDNWSKVFGAKKPKRKPPLGDMGDVNSIRAPKFCKECEFALKWHHGKTDNGKCRIVVPVGVHEPPFSKRQADEMKATSRDIKRRLKETT